MEKKTHVLDVTTKLHTFIIASFIADSDNCHLGSSRSPGKKRDELGRVRRPNLGGNFCLQSNIEVQVDGVRFTMAMVYFLPCFFDLPFGDGDRHGALTMG